MAPSDDIGWDIEDDTINNKTSEEILDYDDAPIEAISNDNEAWPSYTPDYVDDVAAGRYNGEIEKKLSTNIRGDISSLPDDSNKTIEEIFAKTEEELEEEAMGY